MTSLNPPTETTSLASLASKESEAEPPRVGRFECFNSLHRLIFAKFLRSFFPFSDPHERFLLRDAFNFSGVQSYGALNYIQTLSYPTQYFECCSPENPLVVSLIWGVLFKIVAVLSLQTVFVVEEEIKSQHSEARYHVAFPLLPHQFFYFTTIFYHLYGAFNCLALVCCRDRARKTDPIAPIPRTCGIPWGRIAWFCHVVSLPGTIAGFFMYLQLNHSSYPPGTPEYREAMARNELTKLTWGFEAGLMTIDMIMGQGILLACHLFPFLVFWILYSWILILSEGKNLNIEPGSPETLKTWAVCTLLVFGVYVVCSFICGLRLRLSRSPQPLSRIYSPLPR